jgi:hypothetical protein
MDTTQPDSPRTVHQNHGVLLPVEVREIDWARNSVVLADGRRIGFAKARKQFGLEV